MFTVFLYNTFTVQIPYKLYSLQLNRNFSNYTQLLLHVQLNISTAHLLYKLYSSELNCTYSNYTQLLLHVQLHNSTAQLLYKYCTNCTVYNRTVLTVKKQKPLLHVQLLNSRESIKAMFSEAGCRVFVYIDSHSKRLDSSNRFRSLRTDCLKFTALRNTRLCSSH
jgi:hypothetical protein